MKKIYKVLRYTSGLSVAILGIDLIQESFAMQRISFIHVAYVVCLFIASYECLFGDGN